MKIITVNVNGIRAAGRKGFFDWLAMQSADVVCLQELKAQPEQIEDDLFHPHGYSVFYHAAKKKGYSGVGIYSKLKPNSVQYGIGWQEVDCEGRFLQVSFNNLNVVSLYMHSGSASEERQQIKYQFMNKFMPWLEQRLLDDIPTIICGDWNIAHKNEDLRNWKGNKKNSGFLPQERAWLDQLFDEVGYIDGFRQLPQDEHQYTWWSNRGKAWDNNVGWRIDYQILTPHFKNKVINTDIYKAERFSDHAPLVMEYDYDIQ